MKGGRKSAEALKARALVLKGMSGYAAAKLTGVHQSTISRDPEVIKYRQEKANAAKSS